MGNADYLAAFLHVLLPLAFEVTAGGGLQGWNKSRGRVSLMGLPFTPSPPACLQFDPELVLIAAGFDSAIGDPEVRAWADLEDLWCPVARPPSHPALVPGADAGHARVLRPPDTAAAGAGQWPRLRHAGGDCGEQGPEAEGQLEGPSAPVTPLSSSLLPGWLQPGVAF